MRQTCGPAWVLRRQLCSRKSEGQVAQRVSLRCARMETFQRIVNVLQDAPSIRFRCVPGHVAQDLDVVVAVYPIVGAGERLVDNPGLQACRTTRQPPGQCHHSIQPDAAFFPVVLMMTRGQVQGSLDPQERVRFRQVLGELNERFCARKPVVPVHRLLCDGLR